MPRYNVQLTITEDDDATQIEVEQVAPSAVLAAFEVIHRNTDALDPTVGDLCASLEIVDQGDYIEVSLDDEDNGLSWSANVEEIE